MLAGGQRVHGRRGGIVAGAGVAQAALAWRAASEITTRDYTAAAGGQAALDAVEQAAAELAAFEEAALHAEAPEPMNEAPRREHEDQS